MDVLSCPNTSRHYEDNVYILQCLHELHMHSMSYLFMCVFADWQGTKGPGETYATTVTPRMMMMSKRLRFSLC